MKSEEEKSKQFKEPLSTEAMDFFESEENKMKKLHVSHVLTAQRDILTMSNNFTRQLEHLNRKDRADSNLPIDDIKEIEEVRNYDAKLVKQIAETVMSLKKEIQKLKYKVEKLTADNKEIANQCKDNHQKVAQPANWQHNAGKPAFICQPPEKQ